GDETWVSRAGPSFRPWSSPSLLEERAGYTFSPWLACFALRDDPSLGGFHQSHQRPSARSDLRILSTEWASLRDRWHPLHAIRGILAVIGLSALISARAAAARESRSAK